MKTKFFILSMLFFCIFSCKKENVEVDCSSPFENTYIPLSVGSYWIYQWYEVDTLSNETILENKVDTIRIVGDTIINGLKYFIQHERNSFNSTMENRRFLRDSLGHLVNPQNEIFFSATNFTDTLNSVFNLPFNINWLMESGFSIISIPLGDFECLNFQGRVVPLNINVDWTERYLNNYYSKGIGKIQENTFFASSPNNLEKRLIEYHIE